MVCLTTVEGSAFFSDRTGISTTGQEQPLPVLGLCGVTGKFCLVFSRFDVIFKVSMPHT